MEKRISFVQFQSAKSVAKAIDPIIRQRNRIQAQIDGLDEEFKAKAEQALAKLKDRIKTELETKKTALEAEVADKNSQIDGIEAGIVQIIGFKATDLVKKVIETDSKGNKVTKYIPTDIVSYDTTTKEYVITVPDEQADTVENPVEEPEFQPEADNAEDERGGAGVGAEPANEQESENKMPWENQ